MTYDANVWARVQTICEAALGRGPEDRAAFVAHACEGDFVVRHEVESLLAQEARAEDFLSDSALELLAHTVVTASSGARVGQRIGPYELLELIGAGGMGEVYKARDTRLDRLVAIKMLPGHVADSPERRAQLEREAHIVAQLSHPHIRTLFDVGFERGTAYLVAEYLEGQTLAERLRTGPLPIADALQCGIEIADAVNAAHCQGIVHRDLKPANVMLTKSGVKLLDFGIATASVAAAARPVVASPPTNDLLGTPRYMSPEQMRGDTVDERSDLFALGVVLYEMLTGHRAFPSAPDATMSRSILSTSPTPPSRENPAVPRALDAIVVKAIENDPRLRHKNVAELQVDLQRLLSARRRVSKPAMIAGVVALLTGVGAVSLIWQREARQRVAVEVVPEIARLVDAGEFGKAATLAQTARAALPHDPTIARLWERSTVPHKLETDPPGADVEIRRYASDPQTWEHVGRTPLANVRVPRAANVWRITKAGYAAMIYVRDDDYLLQPGFHDREIPLLHLQRAEHVPAGMVVVPGGPVVVSNMPLGPLATTTVSDFLIDQHEVTNEQYQRFVDAGGYQHRTYWKQTLLFDGKEISWNEAISRFRDATGRPGPATWHGGTYPDGFAQHPVGGLSWYEAAAYAEFAGRLLPTAFHWTRASQNTYAVIASSGNFRGSGTREAGRPLALSGYGTTDMAGNIKEWCFNEGRDGKRFILGGGFGEPAYMFSDTDEQSPWERRPNFGLRTMKLDTAAPPAAMARIESSTRDFSKESPVSDDVFAAFLGLYEYDRTELNARIEESESTEAWTREKVTFDAPYGHERVITHLFLPSHGSSPFQTVVYVPGGFAVYDDKLNLTELEESLNFVMKSGRALLAPIYKGTYERRDGMTSSGQPPAFYRDHVIMIAKDLRRSLDYLESRRDIDATKIGYLGASFGAQLAPIFLAVEPRIKAAILDSGGLMLRHDLPEIDRINFVPRVRTPVLMLNGRFDTTYPLQSSQLPLFRMLGTPAANKKHAIYDAGHGNFPQREKMREVLGWLDKYLGFSGSGSAASRSSPSGAHAGG